MSNVVVSKIDHTVGLNVDLLAQRDRIGIVVIHPIDDADDLFIGVSANLYQGYIQNRLYDRNTKVFLDKIAIACEIEAPEDLGLVREQFTSYLGKYIKDLLSYASSSDSKIELSKLSARIANYSTDEIDFVYSTAESIAQWLEEMGYSNFARASEKWAEARVDNTVFVMAKHELSRRYDSDKLFTYDELQHVFLEALEESGFQEGSVDFYDTVSLFINKHLTVAILPLDNDISENSSVFFKVNK